MNVLFGSSAQSFYKKHKVKIVKFETPVKSLFLSNHQISRLKDIDSEISNLTLESNMLEWRENNKIKPESPPKEIENLFYDN